MTTSARRCTPARWPLTTPDVLTVVDFEVDLRYARISSGVDVFLNSERIGTLSEVIGGVLFRTASYKLVMFGSMEDAHDKLVEATLNAKKDGVL